MSKFISIIFGFSHLLNSEFSSKHYQWKITWPRNSPVGDTLVYSLQANTAFCQKRTNGSQAQEVKQYKWFLLFHFSLITESSKPHLFQIIFNILAQRLILWFYSLFLFLILLSLTSLQWLKLWLEKKNIVTLFSIWLKPDYLHNKIPFVNEFKIITIMIFLLKLMRPLEL